MLLAASLVAACTSQTSGGRATAAPATSDELLTLSIMHGLSSITGSAERDSVSRPSCEGSGVDQAHAVQMRSIHGQGQIADVVPCALLLYPGAQVYGSAFVVDDGRYYSVAQLKDVSGQEREVYTDITGWAEAFLVELRQKKPQG